MAGGELHHQETCPAPVSGYGDGMGQADTRDRRSPLAHQIDQRGRGRTLSRAGAGLVAARVKGIGFPLVNGPSRASSSFVGARALALANGGRQLLPPAGGRQLTKPHFQKPVRHGALHLSHAPSATASGGDGDRSRTPALDCVVQGLREPVLDFHSFTRNRDITAARANGQAVSAAETFTP